MAHPGGAEAEGAVSPMVVEILESAALPQTVALPDTCLCCDGAVDDELSVVSELVLERQEHPILEVLQVGGKLYVSF